MSIKKVIQRIVRLSPLGKMGAYHLLRFYTKQKRMKREIQKNGGDYGIERLLMKEAMVKYHWDFDEYYMYDYAHLSSKERESFVPEYEKNVFCDKVNDAKDSKIFDSKWQSYLHFRNFYHRDCLLVTKKTVKSKDTISFLERHPRFIMKPDSSASGRGIIVIEGESITDATTQVLNRIAKNNRPYIIEEMICQSKEMAAFHPLSVNSLRMRTFRFDDHVEILPCNMRLGRGGSFVDNTGKGGISVALDKDGFAIAACNEAGERFEVHPDTGELIIGRKVPYWEEAVELASKLALVIPKVRYVGWDLALTDEGWIMIEGNDKGMFVGIQKPTQKGFRPYMNKILSEVGIEL